MLKLVKGAGVDESQDHISGGYILLARKLLDNEIMRKPPLYLKLWIWMLGRAYHSDTAKGLKRGQFQTSIAEMREAMTHYVGYRKVTPSAKEIRTIYESLREALAMGTTKGTRGMIITINNYSKYQDPKNYEGHNEKSTKGTAGAHAIKGNKNEKNDNTPLTPHGGDVVADGVFDFYVGKIDPEKKSRYRGVNNIRFWLKRHTEAELRQAVINFFPTAERRLRHMRNDPANFFGQKDPVFKDYLQARSSAAPSPGRPPVRQFKAPEGWEGDR
jgi:hypothetical protein